MKVINMGKKSDDGRLQSVENMLKDFKKSCEENDGDNKYKRARKAILITLDRTDDHYDAGYHQAGLSGTEIISLLRWIEFMIFQDMYYGR